MTGSIILLKAEGDYHNGCNVIKNRCISQNKDEVVYLVVGKRQCQPRLAYIWKTPQK